MLLSYLKLLTEPYGLELTRDYTDYLELAINLFVTVIYQRPNGEIWLGTTSGLSLFDGN